MMSQFQSCLNSKKTQMKESLQGKFGWKRKLQREKEIFKDIWINRSSQLKFQEVLQDLFINFSWKKKLRGNKRIEKLR